jgi:hypothetical protein
MLSVKPRLWITDRIAWAILASGVAMMFGVLYVSFVFGGYGDTVGQMMDRARLRTAVFLAAAAFAISGPLVATIGTWIAGHACAPLDKKSKVSGLEDL